MIRTAATRLAACAALMACAHAPMDRGARLGDPAEGTTVLDVPVRGFHVRVETEDTTVSGELLAVDDGSVYVEEDSRGKRIERQAIRRVEVEVHDSGSTVAGIATAIGTVSTVSHGMLLIISAPVWLLAGISASAAESQGNDAVFAHALDGLRAYARYPQGLPGSATAQPPAQAPAPQAAPAADVQLHDAGMPSMPPTAPAIEGPVAPTLEAAPATPPAPLDTR